MANGNGTNGRTIQGWITMAGVLLALGLSVFASAKDTPTRTEVESKITMAEARRERVVDRQLDAIAQRLGSLEATNKEILRLLLEERKP